MPEITNSNIREDNTQLHEYFSLRMKEENETFDASNHIILLTFDDNYVNQSINLILSISEFHKNEISYICLCPPLKQENVQRLLKLEEGIRICCYDFKKIVDPRNWPACAMFRLFSPWLLEDAIHKVLYLDSDIICAGNIDKLLNMETAYIAMCPEIAANIQQFQHIQNNLPTQIYCNSGVCLINLSALRNEYSFARILGALVGMRSELLFPDQDFLNFFYKGKIEYLNSYMYNFIMYDMKGSIYYRKALNQAKLIHFAAATKPWKHNCNLFMIRVYLKYSQYPPMRSIVKRAMWKSCLHSVVRLNRPVRRWYSDVFLYWKRNHKRQ